MRVLNGKNECCRNGRDCIIDPWQFFMTAGGGRSGLVDASRTFEVTALRTESGEDFERSIMSEVDMSGRKSNVVS